MGQRSECWYSYIFTYHKFSTKIINHRNISSLNVSSIGGIAEVMAANDGARGPTPPATGVNAVIRELRVSTNLNCCVCYLKLGDTTRALDFAQRAVDLGNHTIHYICMKMTIE